MYQCRDGIRLISAILVVCLVSLLASAQDFTVRCHTKSTVPLYCGVDALYVLLALSGNPCSSIISLESELIRGPSGTSLQDLADACAARSVHMTLMRTDVRNLPECATPSILRVKKHHFVTLLESEQNRLVLFDNEIGVFDCSLDWFTERYEWDGIILMYGPPSPMMAISLYRTQLLIAIPILAILIWVVNRRKIFPINLEKEPQASLSSRTSSAVRSGFTLIEAIVVVAVIGILAMLIVPAVQKVRESAARATCLNHIREIGIAAQSFQAAHSIFPHNGGGPIKSIPARDGTPFIPSTIETGPQAVTWQWAVGAPQLAPRQQTGSWAYSLLPHLEQQAVFNTSSAWETGIFVLVCPSRRNPEPVKVSNDIFGTYVTGGWAWARSDYAANKQLIRGRPLPSNNARITDGSSQTIIYGEKAAHPKLLASGSWYFDEPIFLGNTPGSVRNGSRVLTDPVDASLLDNWGSAHLGGANFSLADGSARWVSISVSPTVIQSLLTPAAGDPVGEF